MGRDSHFQDSAMWHGRLGGRFAHRTASHSEPMTCASAFRPVSAKHLDSNLPFANASDAAAREFGLTALKLALP